MMVDSMVEMLVLTEVAQMAGPTVVMKVALMVGKKAA